MRLIPRFSVPTDTTQGERIAPTASEPVLNSQELETLIALCEEAMTESPYTNRAVYLCRLIDKLEVEMLSR